MERKPLTDVVLKERMDAEFISRIPKWHGGIVVTERFIETYSFTEYGPTAYFTWGLGLQVYNHDWWLLMSTETNLNATKATLVGGKGKCCDDVETPLSEMMVHVPNKAQEDTLYPMNKERLLSRAHGYYELLANADWSIFLEDVVYDPVAPWWNLPTINEIDWDLNATDLGQDSVTPWRIYV